MISDFHYIESFYNKCILFLEAENISRDSIEWLDEWKLGPERTAWHPSSLSLNAGLWLLGRTAAGQSSLCLGRAASRRELLFSLAAHTEEGTSSQPWEQVFRTSHRRDTSTLRVPSVSGWDSTTCPDLNAPSVLLVWAWPPRPPPTCPLAHLPSFLCTYLQLWLTFWQRNRGTLGQGSHPGSSKGW